MVENTVSLCEKKRKTDPNAVNDAKNRRRTGAEVVLHQVEERVFTLLMNSHQMLHTVGQLQCCSTYLILIIMEMLM